MKKANRKVRKKAAQTYAEVLLQSAGRILGKTGSAAIMVYADSLPGLETIKVLPNNVPVILVTRDPDLDVSGFPAVKATITVPAFNFTRLDQIKLAAVIGLAQGALETGQKIVCVAGIAGAKNPDTLMALEIGAEFEIFGHHAGDFLSANVSPEVLVRTIDLAARLSLEGREGKPVGTCFVLGDNEKVLSYTRQMTINPFRGYPEEERNILSPELEETVKEFAAIDGAFVVSDDGVILTAGAYLQPPGGEKALEPGLGARHAAAAAITEATGALAVVLSESTGTVRLYRDGGAVMAIERPTGPA
jgi:DNA integrity scanning protein DisA with diadenylate cyclase activity